MWLWTVLKVTLLPLYRLTLQMEVEGTENVPESGGVILCSNHISGHDPGMVGLLSPRAPRFMTKEEVFRWPVIRWFATHGGGAFPVKRGTADRGALRKSLEILEHGGCLGIFPEGTRSRTGQLQKAEPGSAYLALKSGAPVIPVGISGKYKPFHRLRVRFGKPVDLTPYSSGRLSSENLEAAGDSIMAAIAGLLEPPGGH